MSGWRGQLKVGISLVSKLHALLGKGKGMGGAHLLAVDTGSSALFGSSPLGSGGWNSQPFVSFSLQHSP